MSAEQERYLALTGGVGGAKLCLGLAHVLGPQQLAFAVNTGDDFEHYGLHISPDLDTLTYTLSNLANPELGWGRAGETWRCIEALKQLGGEGWFNLGDADLATHLMRTERLRCGDSLDSVTREITETLGIAHRMMPMSNEPVRTVVHTANGDLAFQHYFVRDRCEPVVTGFSFDGAERATMNAELKVWLQDSALAGVIICPSNPYVSIDPILAVPGVRALLQQTKAPIVAVSPIVDGAAIKGPTAKMMNELDVPATAPAVAAHYRSLIDGFIVDQRDAPAAETIADTGLRTTVAQTVMVTLDDRVELAHAAIDFLRRLRSGK